MRTTSRFLSVALALGLGVVVALWLLSALGAERAALAQAGTGVIRVATTGSDVAGCGGAANPCRTIQYAVDAAQPGDEIHVASGVYGGVHNIPALSSATFTATQSVAINKSLVLRGGYATTDWVTSLPQLQPTTLDAQHLGRVLLITGTAQVTLEGLRITGGLATGLGGHETWAAGGGAYIYGASVTISNCEVYANAAVSETEGYDLGYGGGLYLRDSSDSTLRGNTIHHNTGSWNGHGSGGGAYLNNCPRARLEQNVIRDNRGTGWRNGEGGGVALHWGADIIVRGNEFINNTGGLGANYDGGGLHAYFCPRLLISGNTFRGNLAGGGWSQGGALRITYSYWLVLSRNLFEDNTASLHNGWGGAIALEADDQASISGNVLRNNRGTSNPAQASWGGGAHILGSGPYTLTNNAFVGNDATASGSGLCIEDAQVRLLHNTFAANVGGDGTGVCITGTYGLLNAINTIVANHALGINVTGGATVTLDTTLWYGNGQDWLGNVTHTADLTANPAFAADGYHLTRGSPAVDQAVNAGVTTDIDGQPRPAGAGYDIGADEFMYGLYLPTLMRRYAAGP